MKTVYSLIGLDKEYSHTLSALSEQIEAKKPLPLVINGLSGGALDSFCYDIVSHIGTKGRCALVIVPTESEAIRVSEMLRSEDIPNSTFLYRESVLYNISASHDSDRERLSTLKALLDGSLSAVVTTPTGAISYTMPPAQLEAYSLCLEVGKTLEIEELCDKLADEHIGLHSVRHGVNVISVGTLCNLACLFDVLNSYPVILSVGSVAGEGDNEGEKFVGRGHLLIARHKISVKLIFITLSRWVFFSKPPPTFQATSLKTSYSKHRNST